MIDQLIHEYIETAQSTVDVDYSDKRSVRRHNNACERMRSIASEVAALGADAVKRFSVVLEQEPAAAWAAHHLVELSELDSETLARCFSRVELTLAQAEANGNSATAMGEEMWLNEWRAKKSR